MHDGVLRIEDMHYSNTADAQHIRDQRPVAAPPYRFRAHERGAQALYGKRWTIERAFQDLEGHLHYDRTS